MGWSDWCSSKGYRESVSTQETLLWFSQKISAVPDTACGSEPSLCTEQSAAKRPSLEQGLLRGLFWLRHSLDSLLSSPGRHCHGNLALGWALSADKCLVYQVNAALHLHLLRQKSKSCSESCAWYQWYLSVLAVVLHQQCMSTPATLKSWQIASYYSDPLPWEVLWIFLPLWWRWDGEGASPSLLLQAEVACCLLFISSYPNHQDQHPHKDVS